MPPLVVQISDTPPPKPEAIDVGEAPTGEVTAASLAGVGTIRSTDNVEMDENPNSTQNDAEVSSEKSFDAVMSNASTEFVAVDHCPQDCKIHVDLTVTEWKEVYCEDIDEDIIVLTLEDVQGLKEWVFIPLWKEFLLLKDIEKKMSTQPKDSSGMTQKELDSVRPTLHMGLPEPLDFDSWMAKARRIAYSDINMSLMSSCYQMKFSSYLGLLERGKPALDICICRKLIYNMLAFSLEPWPYDMVNHFIMMMAHSYQVEDRIVYHPTKEWCDFDHLITKKDLISHREIYKSNLPGVCYVLMWFWKGQQHYYPALIDKVPQRVQISSSALDPLS